MMQPKFEDLTTDVSRVDFIRDKLRNDERWILRGMYAIYQLQTEEEKQSESTRDNNGVGFSGIDGEIMTSFSNQMVNRGFVQQMNNPGITIRTFFSEKQEKYVRKYMPRYARQLVKIATGKI
jgi:hypothetical protein